MTGPNVMRQSTLNIVAATPAISARLACPRLVIRQQRSFALRALPSASLSTTKLKPLGDRIVVQPCEKAQSTPGGILLPESSQAVGMESLVGKVLHVGSAVKTKFSPGDLVLYSRYNSADVEAAEGEVSFVAESSIVAKLSE